MLDLDLAREGVAPRDAATLILVRDGSAGLEVFCVERNKKSRFLGGAIVFPGGKVDAGDHDALWDVLTTAPQTPSSPGFGEGRALVAYAVAALRESLEEAALLPVVGGTLRDAELLALRSDVDAKTVTLDAFLAAKRLVLDTAALVPFARWVTPKAEARRYDTRFFLARAPLDQTGAHDSHETMASFWARPADILARFAAGEIQLAPPTHRTLEILAGYNDAAGALAATASACLEPICPRLVPQIEGDVTTMALVMPGDPEHEVRELRAPGTTRFVMRGDRFLPEHAPIALAPAPNATA